MVKRTLRKSKRSSRKQHGGARKTMKKGNEWTGFVTGVFKEMKLKNPDATFKDAMKEASRLKKAGKMKL